MPDLEHWDVVVPNLTHTWRICVLPELTSRWYTRKQHLPAPLTQIGFATVERNWMKVKCTNKDCHIKRFHYSCLRVTEPIPKTWYCPTCRLLPKFQKSKRSSKVCNNKPNNEEALSHTSVCICGKKATRTERLIK